MHLIVLFCLLLVQLNYSTLASNDSSFPLIFPHYTQLPIVKLYKGEIQLDITDELVLENRERFIKTLDGASCAVVGGSSNLIGSNYGEFIDSHDVVFRTNAVPILEKFAKDAGMKTTVKHINNPEVSLEGATNGIDFTNKNVFLEALGARGEALKRYEPVKENLVLFSYENIYRILGNIKIPAISSGMQSIAIALTLCNKIDVFGFGKDINGKSGYYYNNVSFYHSWHMPDEQQLYIEELARQKQINLYMGNAEKNL